MLRALRHRGPDGEALVRDGPVLLVFTRLAIVDVEGGSQPFRSEDGACLAVVNGEIYNHLELRRELERLGHAFRTRSDCEVVLHAYEQFGADCVSRLNGIFAFVVWDRGRRRLLAARDHFGVKPLYWSSNGPRIALASEIRTLLGAGVATPALDRVALDHFLALGFVPSPRTLFAGIQKLPPASTLCVDRDGLRIASYREPPGEPYRDSSEALERELHDRFLDAVERQLMSDVPYGAFLSGGLDSAAIAAAMGKRSGIPPRTFTVGFPDFAGHPADERETASRTAMAIGADHHETAILERNFDRELSGYVHDLEEPCSRTSSPALRRLSHFASASVKLVLAGQGADECFGGYPQHQWAAALWPLRRLPASAALPFEALRPRSWASRAARMVRAQTDVDWLLSAFEWSTPEQRSELAGGSSVEEGADERRELAARIVSEVDGSLLDRALHLDLHMILPDRLLIPADKLSMSAGLEYRVPFLDVELMRFVQRIPGKLRTRAHDRKRLLRRAVAPLVPPEVAMRRKQGFMTPYAGGFRDGLGRELQSRFAPTEDVSGVLSSNAVGRLVGEHRSGTADHRLLLICLLELATWHRTFLEQAGSRDEAVPAAT
jgi:asparagine synthase (glutamine-hydrolysing)